MKNVLLTLGVFFVLVGLVKLCIALYQRRKEM